MHKGIKRSIQWSCYDHLLLHTEENSVLTVHFD